MVQFEFILQKTYFSQGFFNVRVAYERYFTKVDGPITIFVGPQKQYIQGRASRRYNTNQTPRVLGSLELRNWFQNNFEVMDNVNCEILGENEIWLKTSER